MYFRLKEKKNRFNKLVNFPIFYNIMFSTSSLLGGSTTGNPLNVTHLRSSTICPTFSTVFNVTIGWLIISLAYILFDNGGASHGNMGIPAICV